MADPNATNVFAYDLLPRGHCDPGARSDMAVRFRPSVFRTEPLEGRADSLKPLVI